MSGEKLPGLEIEGAWHFRRDEVIDWLEQKIQTLDAQVRKSLRRWLREFHDEIGQGRHESPA